MPRIAPLLLLLYIHGHTARERKANLGVDSFVGGAADLEALQLRLGVSEAELAAMRTGFAAWCELHGRTYPSERARHVALENWSRTDLFIRQRERYAAAAAAMVGVGASDGRRSAAQLDQGRFSVGHNALSDRSDAELRALFGTPVGQLSGRQRQRQRRDRARTRPAALGAPAAPAAVDWVARGAVGPVVDQGACGSCWAFSAAEAISAGLSLGTGRLVALSAQQLLSCDSGGRSTNAGCAGGLPSNAFLWVREHGICAQAEYAYASRLGYSGGCESTCTPVARVGGFARVPPSDEAALLGALAERPLSVAVQADGRSFLMYRRGVYDDSSCGAALDHALLLVGYGTEADGTPFWTVKNSWGRSWGEGGYMRLIRGHNLCGIALLATFPTGVAPCVGCTAGGTGGGGDGAVTEGSGDGGGGDGSGAGLAASVVFGVIVLVLGIGLGVGL